MYGIFARWTDSFSCYGFADTCHTSESLEVCHTAQCWDKALPRNLSDVQKCSKVIAGRPAVERHSIPPLAAGDVDDVPIDAVEKGRVLPALAGKLPLDIERYIRTFLPTTKHDGNWMLVNCSGFFHMCTITDGKVAWNSKYTHASVPLAVSISGSLVITVEGVKCTGTRLNDTIKWSDGDEWKRFPSLALTDYNGDYIHESGNQELCNIQDGVLTWRGQYAEIGKSLSVEIDDVGALVLVLNGQVCRGMLQSGFLTWSDGDRWKRQSQDILTL
eukprot:gnl/MRDRNA2_/MRDRNA2_25104_c0_seq1.p1 gnl/MRDRNA2_/MRDRNA2_25104_c0~~gnl/MRDRNA2_/MRDRNA2_25104_c0_seq1.p1  ORF type:complete len:273 (+),score=39.31 gnl/MRDRNA2_/MRDRNA2_25104_c0_seq1:106-924(+)